MLKLVSTLEDLLWSLSAWRQCQSSQMFCNLSQTGLQSLYVALSASKSWSAKHQNTRHSLDATHLNQLEWATNSMHLYHTHDRQGIFSPFNHESMAAFFSATTYIHLFHGMFCPHLKSDMPKHTYKTCMHALCQKFWRWGSRRRNLGNHGFAGKRLVDKAM